MQAQSNEIKLQFRTREGYYRLMNSPDYSQKATGGFNNGAASDEKTCIKVSLVTLNQEDQEESATANKPAKKICFNVGRELFVYNYDGVRAGPDASNPIYKHSYKGSAPTCHDFNQTTATASSLSLLVGFSHGQCQLIEMNSRGDKETCREFNFDRLIDKTRATCIKWLPNSPSLFLVAHASGHLYLYKDDLPCGPSAPVYQLYKQSDGVLIYTCKSKTTRNPIYMWVIGPNAVEGAPVNNSGTPSFRENNYCSLNEFAFSNCAKYFACVSQDGFLRVYCYDTMEMIGRARSYYGGLTCVCWSPDGKYVVTGGEDDLVTVWSFVERRVVARGVGHKSWVTVVAFDPFCSGYPSRRNGTGEGDDDDDDDEDELMEDDEANKQADDDKSSLDASPNRSDSKMFRSSELKYRDNTCYRSIDKAALRGSRSPTSSPIKSYRFGSVGQDTQLCLWDLTDDILHQPIAKSKPSTCADTSKVTNQTTLNSTLNQKVRPAYESTMTPPITAISSDITRGADQCATTESSSVKEINPTNSNFTSSKGSSFTKTFSLVGRRDKFGTQKKADKNISSKANITTLRPGDDPVHLLGTPVCPRMNEIPLLEPIVCKRISLETLTSLLFCKGGFITSCQDGYVFSWARPSRKSSRMSPCRSNEDLRVIDVVTSSVHSPAFELRNYCRERPNMAASYYDTRML